MLVLSRKADQSIVIGDGILVRITQIHGNRVRFAIEAPEKVRILRGELQPFIPGVTAPTAMKSTTTVPANH